jgi:phosphohistidine phosphatase
MMLYLLRHASAEDSASTDAARRLTPDGEAEAKIAGQALARLKIEPARVLTSPLVRAQQTAEIAAKAMKFTDAIETVEELRNDATTAELRRALGTVGPDDALLLVGHMPSLSEHLAAWIGAGNPDALPLDKGGIACVQFDQLEAGKGQLRWLARQKQLKRIAKS